jgi:hypothetical protein
MAMAMFGQVKHSDLGAGVKSSSLKKLATQVLRRWRRINDDRQKLWMAYDASPYARSTARCVWRRHGAMLTYASGHKPAVQRISR